MDTKLTVWILWGEAPDEGTRPSPYIFNTEAQRDAFLLGIAEADGWLGHRIVEGDGRVDEDGELRLDGEESEDE